MAEPQPPNITEGASTSTEPPSAPAGAEARKAAAALSSLDAHTEASESKSGPTSADQKALGEAMSRLEVIEKGVKLGSEGKGKDGASGDSGEGGKGKGKGLEKDRKKVKIEAADVQLLVEELEVGKGRATEMLRSGEGDVGRVLRGFVTGTL